MEEKELQIALKKDFQILYKALCESKDVKIFKLYIDQHPLRQDVLLNLLNSLLIHNDSLKKLRICQVYIEKKHIDIIKSLNNLTSLDISYCVCESDIPFTNIGGQLTQFFCQDCCNISSSQIIDVLKNNPYIVSLSFCAEEFNKEEIFEIVSKIVCLKKLQVCHAHTVDSEFFKVLESHSASLKILKLTKLIEAKSSDMKILFSNLLPKLKILLLEECEHLDSFNVERIAENCPEIIELSLQWSIHIDNTGIRAILEKLSKLHTLNLTGLKKLNNEPFEQVIAKQALALSSLRMLDLAQCNYVTESILKKILAINPKIKIKNYYGELNDFWNN